MTRHDGVQTEFAAQSRRELCTRRDRLKKERGDRVGTAVRERLVDLREEQGELKILDYRVSDERTLARPEVKFGQRGGADRGRFGPRWIFGFPELAPDV